MCILFLYTNPKPEPNTYRLIIISNRDEFYSRPAQQMRKINDVIGGRDMESGRDGGMWLGISVRQFNGIKIKFGALLNVTGETRKQKVKGRGFIVADYLNGEVPVDKYMSFLKNSEEIYNGYNFVAIEVRENEVSTHHYSNISNLYNKYDGKQILGFGNTTPDIPLKKVTVGNERFKTIIDEYATVEKKNVLLEKLLELLKWNEKNTFT